MQRAIALQLKRAPSSLTREFARNRNLSGQYLAASAQRHSQRRRCAAKASTPKLGAQMDSPSGLYVRQELLAWRSPQQIAGRFRAIPDSELGTISHESIYRAIYVLSRGNLRGALFESLRHAHAKRMPRARGKARAPATGRLI